MSLVSGGSGTEGGVGGEERHLLTHSLGLDQGNCKGKVCTGQLTGALSCARAVGVQHFDLEC